MHACGLFSQRSLSPLSVREAAGARESKQQSLLLQPRTTFLDDVVHSAALERSQPESEELWREPAGMGVKGETEMQQTSAATAAPPREEEEEKKEAGKERPREGVVSPMRARGGSSRTAHGQ